MKEILLFVLLLTIQPANYSAFEEDTNTDMPSAESPDPYQLFTEMGLENIVNFVAFQQAAIGYSQIKEKKKEIITLIDFTKPSTEERFYVLDMKNRKLLFSSIVSHGKNSGGLYATSFSNQKGSYKSSLGFYVTENTYQGRNGYSLVLKGLEKGINDRAKERAIVIHGAPYANPAIIASGGRLGRSQGCPALPQKTSQTIINTIKDGSLLFIFANNGNYLAQSSVLNSDHFNRSEANKIAF